MSGNPVKTALATALFVAVVSLGCLGLLAIPQVGILMSPFVCPNETMTYETYSYNTGGESGVSVTYFCENNDGVRTPASNGRMIGYAIALWIGGVFTLVFPIALISRMRKSAFAERIVTEGIPATVTILSMRQTNMRLNDNPVLELEYEIAAKDGSVATFEKSKRIPIPVVYLSRFQPGTVLDALIDPQDTNDVVLQMDTAVPPSTGTGASRTLDPSERLAELKEMFDAGLITYTEFEEKKKQILQDL